MVHVPQARTWYLGIVLLVAWCSSVTFLLPLPIYLVKDFLDSYDLNVRAVEQYGQNRNDKDMTQAPNVSIPNKQSVVRGIWVRWILKLLFVGIGITAAVMVLRNHRRWRLAVGLTSILFLLVWILPFVTYGESPFRSYVVYATALLGSDRWWEPVVFIQREVILPLLHLAVLTLLFSVLRRSSHPTTSP